MTKPVTDHVRAGADAFLGLMEQLDELALANFAEEWDEQGDPRDYIAMAALVEASIRSHLVDAPEQHRQGFVRALVDLICLNIDGCGIDCDTAWDPLKSSTAAFAAPAAAAEAIRKAR